MRWQRRFKSCFYGSQILFEPGQAQSTFSTSIFADRRISMQSQTEESPSRRKKSILLMWCTTIWRTQHAALTLSILAISSSFQRIADHKQAKPVSCISFVMAVLHTLFEPLPTAARKSNQQLVESRRKSLLGKLYIRVEVELRRSVIRSNLAGQLDLRNQI